MIKIWSMKKDEESAKKKKPKTSPAQLRIQKGEWGMRGRCRGRGCMRGPMTEIVLTVKYYRSY